MKITLLVHRIANRAGGAERVVVNVANQLALHGHKVEVLTFESTDGLPFYPLDSAVDFRNLGIMDMVKPGFWKKQVAAVTKWCHSRSGIPPLGRIAWGLMNSRSIRRLRSHLSDNPTDLLIAFLPSAFTIADEVARGLCIPYILSCHNVPEEDFENPARWDQNPIDKRRRMDAMRECSAITVILPEFGDWFPDALRPKVKVIRNFINRPKKAYPSLGERKKRILAVGRFSTPKDHETLLRAWKLIAAQFPDWTVEIYGEGPLGGHLKGVIRQLGLQSHASLHPPSAEIWDLYGDSQIFCMPSKFEGFGLVTAEAMACGTPAVGFLSCPGTNRIILHDQTGILVDCPEDQKIPALAEALKQIIRNDLLRHQYASRSRAEAETYFVENRVEDWFALVESIRAAKTSPNSRSQA